ncbi:MAG TPA: histidine kinase [Nocardioides sp.]|nr:histidine kinase [Nocardioides sp.]
MTERHALRDRLPDGAEAPPWVQVSYGEPPRDQRPERTGKVLGWVSVAALVALVAVAIGGTFAARDLAEAQAVHDRVATNNLLAAVITPVLRDELVTGDARERRAAVAALDEVVKEYRNSTNIVRVKIWTSDGRVVYSDAKALIGDTFPLGEEQQKVLTTPTTRAEVSDLSEEENEFEQDVSEDGRLLEVYGPIWTPNETPLLFETYAPYDVVNERSGELWRGFAGVTISSLLFFALLLLPIVWRLLGRLQRAQSQREQLLERAVDASIEERRRIAGTLHDGVVQELAATSFTVAGAAARAGTLGDQRLAEDLNAVAGTLRTSIGGLRSLLVDIFPANLHTGGLADALADLAAPLRSRGIEVILDLDQDDVDLDPEVERLVFRITQECLHNVRRHSGASRVRIAWRSEGDEMVLDVADDGRGFDPDEVLTSPREGHFGVRVLADVATAAGADLLVSTAPGAGCHWRLRVPRR